MGDLANDEAFLAAQMAYAEAKRKMPRLYARYADAPPNERVELWLDELKVTDKVANLKCRRTSTWNSFVPSAFQSSKKIQVEAAYNGQRLVLSGRLCSVAIGGTIDGSFMLLLEQRQKKRRFAVTVPNGVESRSP